MISGYSLKWGAFFYPVPCIYDSSEYRVLFSKTSGTNNQFGISVERLRVRAVFKITFRLGCNNVWVMPPGFLGRYLLLATVYLAWKAKVMEPVA